MDAAALSAFDIFSGLSDDELASSAELFTELRVLMGEELTEKDDFGYSFFVVLSGTVNVSVDGAVVATLAAGDHFGEKALVSGERRNATVVATETCELAKMMTWDFRELMDQHPTLAQRLQAVAAERDN